MVRELHRNLDHLIAPVAHPDDAQEFYSQRDLRPVQLLFAKKSGGKERYRETYERLKPEIANAKWLGEEYVAMREAANYFRDKETAEILSKSIAKMVLLKYVQPQKKGLEYLLSSVRPSVRSLLSSYDIWLPGLPNRWSLLRAAKSSRSSILSEGRPFSKWLTFFWTKAEIATPRLDNPYQQGFADYLRAMKGHDDARNHVRFLTTCVDLSADVQIELMDIVRTLPEDKLTPELRLALDFPLDRIGEITLDSLATARRVAKWLGNEKAAKEIDHLLERPAEPN